MCCTITTAAFQMQPVAKEVFRSLNHVKLVFSQCKVLCWMHQQARRSLFFVVKVQVVMSISYAVGLLIEYE